MEKQYSSTEKTSTAALLTKEILEVENELTELLLCFREDDFNVAPFEGSWTPAQVAEHLGKSLKGTLKVLRGNTRPADRAPEEKVGATKAMFMNFNVKFESSDRLKPSGEKHRRAELIQLLEEQFSDLRQVAATENLSEIAFDFSLPKMGEFTRSEWIYFTLFHTRRHINQLKKMEETFGKFW